MSNQKRESKKVDDMLQLIEKIDESDSDSNEMFNFNIIAPYTGGKRPDPKRWEDKGIKHRLP